MKNRPHSITIISWIYIAFGSLALSIGLLPSGDISTAQRIAELQGHWYVHVSRILQVLGGVFMLYGFNWARWLVIFWMGAHVIIGALHSPFQFIVHGLIFALLLYFLFRRPASEYFRQNS